MRCRSKYRIRPSNDFSLSKKEKDSFFSFSRDTQSFFSPAIQTKLTVNQSGDALEKEADAVASAVIDQQTKNTGISLRHNINAQRKENTSSVVAPGSVETGIQNTKGAGSTLSSEVKAEMEKSFNADFSNVKIHTDASAAQLNHQLHARAFTTGNDIYFNNGEYKPYTQAGLHLLAHELTHVVQQGHGIHKSDDETNPVHDSIVGNGTTDELKNEIARLEQYLKDHPDTAWRDSIQNKLKSLRIYLLERGNSDMADCDAQLFFNGYELAFKGGRSNSYPAVSGQKKTDDKGVEYFEYDASKQKVAGGPIPEGTYWLNPDQIADVVYPFLKDNDPAWGNYRITIHPFNSTHTFGRGGFFIHGGQAWGSIGCIDLTSYMDSFAHVLAKYNNCGFWSCNPCKVLLTVKYASSKVVLQ